MNNIFNSGTYKQFFQYTRLYSAPKSLLCKNTTTSHKFKPANGEAFVC